MEAATTTRFRRRPQQARSRARVAHVLDVADRLLADEGAEALTTTRIAGAAGISVGSLYQYFPDKGAIVEALAHRYLTEFEELMEQVVAQAAGEGVEDLAGACVELFAERYRAEPGYRALWFGRHLTGELREADHQNKLALAEGLRRILVHTGLARDDAHLATACRAAVLTADALLQEAFRTDPGGEAALLEEAKTILRGYLAAVTDHYQGAR